MIDLRTFEAEKGCWVVLGAKLGGDLSINASVAHLSWNVFGSNEAFAYILAKPNYPYFNFLTLLKVNKTLGTSGNFINYLNHPFLTAIIDLLGVQ